MPEAVIVDAIRTPIGRAMKGSLKTVRAECTKDRSLAADDDRFRLMFYEEARELLIGLEEGLVELERRQGDRARTSTGRSGRRTASRGRRRWSASAAIAEFTHGIEAVLDRIRSGASWRSTRTSSRRCWRRATTSRRWSRPRPPSRRSPPRPS